MAKILVVGAGSIGIYLGIMLQKDNHEVTLLGRNKLKMLPEQIKIGTKRHRLPKRIYDFPQQQHFEYVFITSKLYDLTFNLKKLRYISADHIISIQNGLVDPAIYSKYVKNKPFTIISVFEGFSLTTGGLNISQSKTGWKSDNSKEGKKVSRLLRSAGIYCTSDKYILQIRAEKMIMNCALNVLSAISKKSVWEIHRDPQLSQRMHSLFNESFEVLTRVVPLGDRKKIYDRFMETTYNMHHYPSTYQDVVSGRKTEAEFLNGYVVKLGRRLRIPTPENERLLKEFKKLGYS